MGSSKMTGAKELVSREGGDGKRCENPKELEEEEQEEEGDDETPFKCQRGSVRRPRSLVFLPLGRLIVYVESYS